MRVPPSKETSLVNVPGSNDGARKYGLGLGAPLLRGGHEGMFSGPNRFYEPLAKGFEDVARATALITKDMLMREDQAKVNAALSNFTENELTPYLYGENGEFTKQGEQALGTTKRVADFFKDTPQRYTEGLSKNALAAFTEQIGSRKMAVLSSAAQHEAKERNAWEIGTMEAAAASDADFALNNFGNDRTFYEYNDRAIEQYKGIAARSGFSPEQTELYLREKSSALKAGRIARFVEAKDFTRAFAEWQTADLTADAKFKAQQNIATAYYADNLKAAADNPVFMDELLRAKGWKPVNINLLPDEARQLALNAASEYGVPPDLVLKAMAAESGGNPNAVSPKGAMGLMQLMPGTAKDMGVDINNPADNARGGVKYLKQQLDRFGGDERLALMAYNWGPKNVEAFIATGKGADGQPVPEETKAYVAKILGVDALEAGKPMDYAPDSLDDLLSADQKREQVKANDKGLLEYQKAQTEVAATETYGLLVNQTVGMRPVDAEAYMTDAIARIPDAGVRDGTKKRWDADMKAETERRQAFERKVLVDSMANINNGIKTPAQVIDEVNAMPGLTYEGREKILGAVAKDRNIENDQNRASTVELLTKIDNGDVVVPDEISAFGLEHGLSNKQISSALTYLEKGGNAGTLSLSVAREAYALTSDNPVKARKEFNKDPAIFEAIQSAMPAGMSPNRENAKKVVSSLRMDGEVPNGWFGRTGFEAAANGELGEWTPDVSKEEEAAIKQVLEENGIKANPYLIRKYKKDYMLTLKARD